MHLRKGLISADYMVEISFGTKFSRKDKLNKSKSIDNGYICYLCGTPVQDLSTHIQRIHIINREYDKFEEILLKTKLCQRMSHFQNQTHTKYNPLFSYKSLSSNLRPELITKIITQSRVATIDTPLCCLNSSIYDFSLKKKMTMISYSIPGIYSTFSVLKSLFLNISINQSRLLKISYNKLGRFIIRKSVNMDISNICCVLNRVGAKQLFYPNAINKYITEEFKSGKTPITVHSRVRSLFRFTEYLKNHGNGVLPSTDFKRLQSMLN